MAMSVYRCAAVSFKTNTEFILGPEAETKDETEKHPELSNKGICVNHRLMSI